MIRAATIVLTASASSAAWTVACRALALRWGIVNRPNPIVAQHVRPVPYLGGVAVTLAAILACALLSPSEAPRGLLLPTLAFLALGVADDLKAFSPAPKFLLQVGAALLAVASGHSFSFTQAPAVNAAASAFCILFMVNAFNFTDVADGLVGGLSVLYFSAAAVLVPKCGMLAWSAAGAAAGFLVFNRPRASIFLGDAGSHVLGFWAAVLLMEGANEDPSWSHAFALAMAAGVFLFETVFITAVRIHKGLPWWRGSPDHIALRLQAAGLSTWHTDLLLWGAGALLAIGAWAFVHATTGRLLLPPFLVIASFVAARGLLSLEESPIRRIQP